MSFARTAMAHGTAAMTMQPLELALPAFAHDAESVGRCV